MASDPHRSVTVRAMDLEQLVDDYRNLREKWKEVEEIQAIKTIRRNPQLRGTTLASLDSWEAAYDGETDGRCAGLEPAKEREAT
jgi:hypothetical protein